MIIGSHVSFNNGLLGCVKQSLSYGANTFMFYTGAPQNTVRKALDNENTKEAILLMNENNIDINNVVCHAPYIINLANKEVLSKWEFSISFLKTEISRCEALGVKYIVVHPGSSLKMDRNVALKNISDALNYAINGDTNVTVLLETMAGKGSECGVNISELKFILDNVIFKEKIGICLDTCHLNDSGVNISDFDNYLKSFDEAIGIDKIGCVHVNDSKNPISSHKDRHENIGFGEIGYDCLRNIVYNKDFEAIPKILETPYIPNPETKKRAFAPYKYEIAMLREGAFHEDLKEKILEGNK